MSEFILFSNETIKKQAGIDHFKFQNFEETKN